jgi:hypothetical protein
MQLKKTRKHYFKEGSLEADEGQIGPHALSDMFVNSSGCTKGPN